jgi:hypothetical protein
LRRCSLFENEDQRGWAFIVVDRDHTPDISPGKAT